MTTQTGWSELSPQLHTDYRAWVHAYLIMHVFRCGL